MSVFLARKSSLALAMLAAIPGAAFASSFQILEQSPAHLGTAFAGTASDITDASTVYFNPAAMGQLNSRYVTLGGNVIMTQAEFNDTGSNTGGMPGKTDQDGVVPNFYYVQPLTDALTFGLGVNGPFGLSSRYDDDWTGRYLATHSELEVINISAAFSYDITDRFSVGLGLDYQKADVTLESQFDSTLGVAPNPATDSAAKIEGDDDDFVADVSAFFRPTDATNLGLVWRQGGKFTLDGNATFDLNSACSPGAGYPTGAPPAPTTGTICAVSLSTVAGNAQAELELPDTLTFSFSQQLSSQWALHGDIAWTQWSSIETINVNNSSNGLPISELDLQYDDTMRYALGLTYKTDGAWTWRAGIAFDESPQKNPQLVNPRIPDQDRTWASLGFNYAFSNDMSVDVGYAHVFVDDPTINNIDMQTGHSVQGNFDAEVDIVGIQANWWF